MSTSAAELEWTPSLQTILGSNPAYQLYGEVSIWFHKLDTFRRGESQRIFQAAPTAQDLDIHKRLLLRLMADGEHLLELIRGEGDLIKNPENIKTTDLEAALRSLRDTFRGWHEPIPPERRKQVLKDVFGDVA